MLNWVHQKEKVFTRIAALEWSGKEGSTKEEEGKRKEKKKVKMSGRRPNHVREREEEEKK